MKVILQQLVIFSRLCALFRKDVAAGRPSELNNTVNISIVNSLWKILTGKTFDDLEDPNLRKVAELISDMLSSKYSSLNSLFLCCQNCELVKCFL